MGVNVPLGSTWDPKGVKRAQADLNQFQRQAKGFQSSIGKSILGVGAAFGGAFAVSSITDQLGQMATAAAEDQKSVVALGTALSNVGLGGAARDAEAFVRQLMLATGVADDQLRGALQQAATATGDFALSQRMVTDALDISAATGKDLSTVMTALSKASLGNLGALTRLGIPLDANTIKSRDFAKALGELEQRFRGQAAAAAGTYTGQMQRLSMAVDEAKESIGYALLGAVDDLGKSLGGTDGAISGITSLGDGIAQLVTEAGSGVSALVDLGKAAKDLLPDFGPIGDAAEENFDWSIVFRGSLGWVGKAKEAFDDWRGTVNDASVASNRYKHDLQAQWDAARDGASAAEEQAGAIDEATASMQRQIGAADQLKSALDRLYGNQQSRVEQRIALRRMRQEGPEKSGSRTSKIGKQVAGVDQFGMPTTVTEYTDKITNFTTADDARLFAVDYAQQAGQYAGTFTSPVAQAKVLQDAQQYIAKALKGYVNRPGQFAAGLIGPDAVQSSDFTRGWERMYAPGGGNVVIQQMTVNTDKPAEAVEQARQWAKLARSAPGGRYGAGGAR